MASHFRKLQVHTISSIFRQATKIVEVPLIPPKADEIRVKNIFAGVNATDINITGARYMVDKNGKDPYDIGMEGLGIIDSIGSSVSSSLKVGQPVLVVDPVHNMFSEYLYKDPDSLVPLPELKPNFLVANVNGLTGSIGLDKAGRVQKGDKVLVTASAGGTGQIAVQWAKHRGCYVIGLTSTESKAKFVKELGADEVINYKTENLDQVLKERFPSGIDVVWETIGGNTFKVLLKNLSVKGRMVIIGSTTTYQGEGFADVPIPKLNAKLLMKSQSLNGFGVFHWWSDFEEYLPQLIDMISKDKLIAKVDCGDTSPQGKFIGIEQTARAQEWLHGGKNLGKVVVQLHDL